MKTMLTNRFALVDLFKERGYKVGAEIGVFDGYFSEYMLKTIPDLKLYSVDPWETYEHYRDHRFESSMRRAEELAKERLEPLGAIIIQKYSKEASEEIEDGSLDFVYIDANHAYPYVKQDLNLWTPKVREGGIVSGDDFYITGSRNNGVTVATQEFAQKHGYDLQITHYDRSLPKEDDQQPQWWFTKERND